MNLLLDAHAFIWLDGERQKLSPAAAQACAFRFASGDSEYSKISSGIESIECVGFQSTRVLAIAHVKRSGAVSPAARAIASVVPVRIPPSDVGSTTLSTVRHFETPSA